MGVNGNIYATCREVFEKLDKNQRTEYFFGDINDRSTAFVEVFFLVDMQGNYSIVIMGPNGIAAIHIEAAVMPGGYIVNNHLIGLAFRFEHFQDFILNTYLRCGTD